MGKKSRRKKERALGVDYVGADGAVKRDFLSPQDPKDSGGPGQAYFPTAIAVACTVCKTTATVDMPRNFDHRIADKMMGGRIFKAFCPRCQAVREVRPFTPDELKENGMALLRRYMDNYDELVVQEQGAVTSPADMIDGFQKDSDAFMEEVRKKAAESQILGNTGEEEERPKIILP